MQNGKRFIKSMDYAGLGVNWLVQFIMTTRNMIEFNGCYVCNTVIALTI